MKRNAKKSEKKLPLAGKKTYLKSQGESDEVCPVLVNKTKAEN